MMTIRKIVIISLACMLAISAWFNITLFQKSQDYINTLLEAYTNSFYSVTESLNLSVSAQNQQDKQEHLISTFENLRLCRELSSMLAEWDPKYNSEGKIYNLVPYEM